MPFYQNSLRLHWRNFKSPRVRELGPPSGAISPGWGWQPLWLRGAGDKERFPVGIVPPGPDARRGRRGSTFVPEGSEQGLSQCYQPGTGPRGSCTCRPRCFVPHPAHSPGAPGDRTPCARGSSLHRVILNPLFIQEAAKGQQLPLVATDVQLEAHAEGGWKVSFPPPPVPCFCCGLLVFGSLWCRWILCCP